MFYPEKGKKYVRIRKNHRNYQQEMTRKRRIIRLIVAVVIAAIVSLSVFFGVPERLIPLALDFSENFNGLNHKSQKEPVSETTEAAEQEPEPEPVVEEPAKATVVFTGDVELSDYVRSNYDSAGINGVLSDSLARVLKTADVSVINNEFAFSDRGTAADKQYTFRVSPSYVSILQDFGVDAAGLANNHSLDYGQDALLDTIQTLNDAGIDNTGAGNSLDEAARLVIKEVDGIKIGILACSRVIPYANWDVRNSQPGLFTCYDPSELVSRTMAAREQCDYLFVMIHWGIEQTTNLEAYQSQIGHSVIEAGADAVIGAHPHILQGIEYYNNKPIFYSLGNFIFNQDIPQTAIVKVTADDEGGISYKLIPAYAASATTRLANETDASGYDKTEEILTNLRELSPNVNITDKGVISEK